MARLRFSSLDGVLDMAVTGTDTALVSTGFAALPAVTGPEYLALILDPGETAGPPEIVWVYGHTAASTSVTVFRGMEQNYGAPDGRAHAAGTVWHHGPTPGEFIEPVTSVNHTVSSDPIVLGGRVIGVELNANIEAFTDTGEYAVIELVLLCGSGTPVWTSHTGILISWAGGSAPTLTSTPGNFDVIRLTRVTVAAFGGGQFFAEHVIVDATLNMV